MIVKGGTDRRIRPPPAPAAAVGPQHGRPLPVRRLPGGRLRRPLAGVGRQGRRGAPRAARDGHRHDDDSVTTTPPAPAPDRRTISIAAVGDTMLGSTPQLPPSPGTYLAAMRADLR